MTVLLLSPAQLAAAAPDCNAELLAPALASAAGQRGIVTPLRLAHWLAQLHVETAGFTRFEENLNYSTQRLMAVWPRRFPNLPAAQAYAGNPEKLANFVYGGRMGNTAPDDGWRYRGRGAGLTGRDNYRHVGQVIGVDLLTNPQLAARPDVFGKIAAAFWQTHNLSPFADADDVVSITEIWNGGLHGLGDRKDALARYKAELGVRVA